MLDEEAFQRPSLTLWNYGLSRRSDADRMPVKRPNRTRSGQRRSSSTEMAGLISFRLNEEVRALGEMKLKDGVKKDKGEAVYLLRSKNFPQSACLNPRIPIVATSRCSSWTTGCTARLTSATTGQGHRTIDSSEGVSSHRIRCPGSWSYEGAVTTVQRRRACGESICRHDSAVW